MKDDQRRNKKGSASISNATRLISMSIHYIQMPIYAELSTSINGMYAHVILKCYQLISN